MVRDVVEQVDVTGTVNTILMDCLHHGIKTVQELDTSVLVLPEMEAQKLSESVIYAALPSVASSLSKEERKAVLQNHDMYVEGLVDNYFRGEDYTLIYITESRYGMEMKEETPEGKEYQMENEVPLVGDLRPHGELVRRNLKTFESNTSGSNQTLIDGPLFDKYQFLSPGKSRSPRSYMGT